jgi:hypothetical protein
LQEKYRYCSDKNILLRISLKRLDKNRNLVNFGFVNRLEGPNEMKVTAAALCLVSALTIGGHAFAAERALPPIIAENEPPNRMTNHHVYARVQKPAGPAQCKDSVDDVLHHIAGESKSLSVSQALTPKQYSFVRDAVKTHSANHKEAPGDGAIVIDANGVFAVLLTKGLGSDAKICAFTVVPVEVVVGIVAADEPPKATSSPDTKSEQNGTWQ